MKIQIHKIIGFLNRSNRQEDSNDKQVNESYSAEIFGSHTDISMVKDYLENLAQKAKDEHIYSIWSWVNIHSGETCYEFIPNISLSNDFEFDSADYVSNKTMLYEAGTIRTAGRELVDGPKWMEKDNEKEKKLSGGDLGKQLFEAIDKDDLEDVKELLEKGADVNSFGGINDWSRDTTLKAAANADSIEMVDLLVKNGADINYKNAEGFPLIALIAHEDNPNTEAIIKMLIKAGADIYATNAHGATAIDLIQHHHPGFILKNKV